MSSAATPTPPAPARPSAANIEDFLWKVHAQLADQIKFADQKAGFIAVLSTGVMGGLHTVRVHEAFTQHSIGEWGWSGWAGVLAFALLVLSLLACFAAIAPRRRSNQKTGYIFWGGIAAHESEQAFYQQLAAATTDEIVAHLANQTYGLASICKEKYTWLSYAIFAAVAGSELGGFLLLFSAFSGS